MATGSTAKPVDDWKTIEPSDWQTVGAKEEPTVTAAPKSWAEKLGITNPLYKKELDTLEGAASGAARTLSNIAEATYRGATSQSGGVPTGRDVPPAGMVTSIPAVKSARTTPASFEGNLGRGMEQIAEYAVPAGRVGALAKTANAGTLMRAVTQGGTAAAVAGGQSGMDPLSMIVAGGLGAGGEVAIPAVKQYVAEHVAPWLYQSALKPRVGSNRISLADVNDEIEQGLNKEIPVSASGYEKAKQRISDLMQQVYDRLQRAGQDFKTIDPLNVVKPLDELALRPPSVTPEAGAKTLSDVRAEYLRQHTGTPVGWDASHYKAPVGPQPYAALTGQAEKQATYQELGDAAYGELSGAGTEGRKSLAHGIKTEIERIFPEVKPENEEEGITIGLASDIAHRLKLGGNKDITGITGFHTLARALQIPEISSKLAIILRKAGVSESSIAARMRLLRSGTSAGISNLREQEPQNVGSLMQGAGQ